MLRAHSLVVVIASMSAACAVGVHSYGTGGDGTGPATDDSGAPIWAGPDSGSGDPGASGCSDAAKLIYVVAVDGSLYSFNPPTLTFTSIGTLSCPSGGQPNSMAIDRNATAWVNYTTGEIFKVSTKDASCSATSWAARGLLQPFSQMGMGFSVNSASTTDETLYVSDVGGGAGLAKLDLGSMTLSPIASFGPPHTGAAAELTGTGDGRLYGFFPGGSAGLSQLNKSNGQIMDNQAFKIAGTTVAWAFSFWGGSFYLYTSPCDGITCTTGSTVTKYDPTSKTATTVKQVPFIIDGAGVSTCAPLQPVN